MSNVLVGQSLNAFIAANAANLGQMVTIPGGTFLMGIAEYDDDHLGQELGYPQHRATLSTFRMGVTPVTNEDYERYLASLGDRRFALVGGALDRERVLVLGTSAEEVYAAVDRIPLTEFLIPNPSEVMTLGGLKALARALEDAEAVQNSLTLVEIEDPRPRAREGYHPRWRSHVDDMNRLFGKTNRSPLEPFERPRQPVVDVTWFEAVAYATLHGGRLPTEWEWEYAAKVTPGTEAVRKYATPSGDLADDDNTYWDLDAAADVDDPRWPTLPNGVRHMMSRVLEWMHHRYGEYTREPVIDPAGHEDGDPEDLRWTRDDRVLRGGPDRETTCRHDNDDADHWTTGGVRYGIRVVVPSASSGK